MKADRITGAVLVLAGFGLALATSRIDILASQPTLSARFFPYVLAVVLLAGGAVLAIRPGQLQLAAAIEKVLAVRGVAFAGAFLAYALAFRFVDFRLSTWAFVLATMWLLGARSRIELLILPVVVSATTYLLFRHGFTVLLPTWI